MIQKSHILNSFFENIISGIQSFYICPDVPVDIIRVFFIFRFSSRKSQRQQKLAKKITHFTIQFRSKNLAYFTKINSLDIENNMLQKCNQKPFWLYKFSGNMFTAPFLDSKELHSWTTLKANAWIFLYISLRKLLFQRRFYLQGFIRQGVGLGRLNNFLKAARCLGLVKCFTIFRFNWYFWKFNCF